MAPLPLPAIPRAPAAGARVPRIVWHSIGLLMAALLAYAIWRGYQNPDFLLDLAAFRLC
jgi:hypothetical protein